MTLLWLAILILLTVLGKRCQTKPLLKQSSAYC